jgi:hypothetical protein
MSANLTSLFSEAKQQKEALDRISRFDGGDGGGYDSGMEARVTKLESFVIDTRERLVKIEGRLDGIDSRMATKVDLSEGFSAIIKWVVGTAVGLGVAAITVMTFVLNNAAPKAPASQPIPIVIQIPNIAPTAPPTQK